MSHQDQGLGQAISVNHRALREAIDWLLSPEDFSKISFRIGCRWTPLTLVATALLWAADGLDLRITLAGVGYAILGEALAVLAVRPGPFLLQSGMTAPEVGRFSFAGAEPTATLVARGDGIEVTDHGAGRTTASRGDVFEVLRGLLAERSTHQIDGEPARPRAGRPSIPVAVSGPRLVTTTV